MEMALVEDVGWLLLVVGWLGGWLVVVGWLLLVGCCCCLGCPSSPCRTMLEE